ncbi:MAG TPA: LacI family DNA-binding transcriptional regulator [Phycisphaerae bacterium]|nr:LacI family DNA-binding transcriptional regulator [Phycisphaerae bacterium]HRW52262.1 LacI family DNA-binding transcriptional regulator [Phycisphaerae bacterium]
MDNPRRITLRDVAMKAGVSVMTVSRALSGKSKAVSPATLQKCRSAAAELGYVPNLLARSLRGEQLNTFCMFAEFIANHHYLAECVDLASREIEDRHQTVILCQSLNAFHHAIRSFNLTGALVIAPPESFYEDPFGHRSLGPCAAPVTVLLHSAIAQQAFSEISPDLEDMTFRCADHLIKLGHRHIAYFGGPRSSDEPHWFSLRERGIHRAFDLNGVPRSQLTHQQCTSIDTAPSYVRQLLATAPETTGIMCINDEIAIVVIHALQEIGRSVPSDISVLGCNNLTVGRYCRPAISTFEFDIRGMVQIALDLLIDEMRARGLQREKLRSIHPGNLVIRESTAPPPPQP